MAYHHELNGVPNESKLTACIVRRTANGDIALRMKFDHIVVVFILRTKHIMALIGVPRFIKLKRLSISTRFCIKPKKYRSH